MKGLVWGFAAASALGQSPTLPASPAALRAMSDPSRSGPVVPDPASHSAAAMAGPRLTGDRITLPLVLVKGFPFVEGGIQGRRGKLLFDLGDAGALTVDSEVVSIPGAVAAGRGFFGSGQTYERVRIPLVHELSLPGGLRFRDIADVPGHPGVPIRQDITPDFIGWLGVGFFPGYVLKLDYARSAATFYRDGPSGRGLIVATRGERVLRTIPLRNPEHPNLPVFEIGAGSVPLEAALDTGTHNVAWLTDDEVARMEADGTLAERGKGTFFVSGLTANGLPLPGMPLEVVRGRPPFAKLLPRPDAPFLSFGCELLEAYRIALDLRGRTLTLMGERARTDRRPSAPAMEPTTPRAAVGSTNRVAIAR